jgi:transposase
MHYIQGRNRDQALLFPETLEDYVSDDNPVLFIDRFVESLNLSQCGFEKSVLQATGRPRMPRVIYYDSISMAI